MLVMHSLIYEMKCANKMNHGSIILHLNTFQSSCKSNLLDFFSFVIKCCSNVLVLLNIGNLPLQSHI